MKSLLIFVFTFSCILLVPGQQTATDKTALAEIVLRKQIACDDLERQSGRVSDSIFTEAYRKQSLDMFLGEVNMAALKANETVPGELAVKKIADTIMKSENLVKIADYYSDRNEQILARNAIEEAIKLVVKAENNDKKIHSLINMIPMVQKIDQNGVSDIIELTAKTINSIPSPGIEDKPQTENYKRYVKSIMAIAWKLLPVLTELSKKNQNEANNLADRINKKEVKVIADFVLMTDTIMRIAGKVKTN